MTDAMVEIHNPSHAKSANSDTLQRVPFPRLQPGDRVRLAFLDNEKPNGTELLDIVQRELGEVYSIEVHRVLKGGGGGFPAPSEMIEEVARAADIAILATCD